MKTFTLESGGSVAEIVPERGALCSRLVLDGEDLLYLDGSTLADPAANVRGGIPVLFPIAGKLPGDAYDGHSMKQHGFARNLPWEPTRTASGRLECRLDSTDDTLRMFPWVFDAQLVFDLSPTALRLEFALHNPGDGVLPYQLGFHPYFRVEDKGTVGVRTEATRAFDNRKAAFTSYAAPDFTAGEVDLHLLDHRGSGTVLRRGARRAVKLRWSPDFRVMVLWTLPGRDFVCVEPWTAPAGALASGAGVLQVQPGDVHRLAFEITLSSP